MFKKTALFSQGGIPYFGNQNSTLGSVVPLAMFVCQALILNKRPEVPANYLNFLKACLHQKLPSASFANSLSEYQIPALSELKADDL